jgi:Helix-turn-helix
LPKERRERIKRIGVPLWQEDLWREVIRAAQSDTPDQVGFSGLTNFNTPAASRYAATTPTLLKWFDGYNAIDSSDEKSYVEQVKPFNFLLSLEIKSKLDMAKCDMAALRDPLWYRRVPRPAAPYGDGDLKTFENAFDRDKPEFTRIPVSWLKSYARSLTRYHMHSEAKFWGGTDSERGKLRRRQVHAVAYQSIGKEADNLEEREFIGDDEDAIEHEMAQQDQSRLRAFIIDTRRQLGISDRELCKVAKVSSHTMAALHGNKPVKEATLFIIARVIETIRQNSLTHTDDQTRAMQLLHDKKVELGSDEALAEFLGVSRSYVTYLLNGERRLTVSLIKRLEK